MQEVLTLIVVPTLLLIVLSTALACSPPQAAGVTALDADDAGRRVELSKGQALDISLASNPTTGYRWEVKELDEAVLRQVGEPEFKAKSNLVGAPGVEILRFEAVGAGQTTLDLIYHRSWEKGVDPLEAYSVEVVVQ
jgi:inhibitor of cysteine peptidase